jgi:hypothetical protein
MVLRNFGALKVTLVYISLNLAAVNVWDMQELLVTADFGQ